MSQNCYIRVITWCKRFSGREEEWQLNVMEKIFRMKLKKKKNNKEILSRGEVKVVYKILSVKKLKY